MRKDMETGKIVVVDDDKIIRKLLEAVLVKADYQVFIARDGEDGLNKINEIRPDVVILDVRMPKLDGHEVLIMLKQEKLTRNIPVIMLSSLGLEGDINRGMSLGAAHYLTKPVERDVLLQCIEKVLK